MTDYRWKRGDTYKVGDVLWHDPEPPPWRPQAYYISYVPPVPVDHPFARQCYYMELPDPSALKEACRHGAPWSNRQPPPAPWVWIAAATNGHLGERVLGYRWFGGIDAFEIITLPMSASHLPEHHYGGAFMPIPPLWELSQ